VRREEYPRPQMVRENWKNLNGEWRFAFDDENVGIKNKWYKNTSAYDKVITVPFVYQCTLSGIMDKTPHNIVWYQREFEVKYNKGQKVLLHFGAVDYEADIYVNGMHICHHIGGHTSFEADITDALKDGIQLLCVRAQDIHQDESIPRGKQFWENESRKIWYTASTGIWQTVWFEVVEKNYISSLFITSLYDEGKVKIELGLSLDLSCQDKTMNLDYTILFHGQKIARGKVEAITAKISFVADLFQEHIFRMNYHGESWAWSPEVPNLFDLELTLNVDNKICDKVYSYFGMRKLESKNGMIYLNNMPYYQKLVLDQGYWPEGLLTAPSDEAFITDIKYAKEMGFNGCRKHQKTEDPRFLYWADKLGYIVWGECAASAIFNRDSVERLMMEWKDIIHRDFNHPSIFTWVPINESWGVPNISFDRQQQHFAQALYHFIHSLDTTRLVVSNDGWSITETDIVTIHNYAHGQENDKDKYEYFKETLLTKENIIKRPSSPWPTFAEGFSYQNQPILLTEFGGIGFDISNEEGWGYTSVENERDFLRDYKRVMDAVYASKALWGFCYTQLMDVEQETNGLLTYYRKPKFTLEKIKKINDGYHVSTIEFK